MKALTEKEESLMKMFWNRGPLFVKEIVEAHPEPKPHVNTISTFVRILEEKGFLRHEKLGNTYRYIPTMSEREYGKTNLKEILSRYFNNSLPNLVSALVSDENISERELTDIITRVKQSRDAGE